MAMNLRLTDSEAAALRERADQEGRSMNDVARQAIQEYIGHRSHRLRSVIDRIVTEDAELLERLGR